MKENEQISLAGLLHDIGKFGQRAGIPIEKDSYDFQSYCPQKFGTYWTHQHTAYTADFLKIIVGKQNEYSFIDTYIEDESFENISAKHHKPSTAREWLVAMADRIASGFEREEFDKYNHSDDRGKKLKYYEMPLDGVFHENQKFSLDTFNTQSIAVSDEKLYSKEQYNALYQQFLKDMGKLKKRPKTNFVSGLTFLLKKYTSFIPSSTYKTKANIPLYDHLKTTAAFASALSKFHETSLDIEAIREYKEKKFLLLAGDFFGIQKFIFSDIPASKASKLLRGKSAFIEIFIKVVALDICKKLGVSSLSIITTNAGKFEILLPNLQSVKEKIKTIQQELDQWFIVHTFGESGIGMSFIEASPDDFTSGKFLVLRDQLAKAVEFSKYQKFDLSNVEPILQNDDNKIRDNQHLCKLCNKRFKHDKTNESCEYCNRFIKLGQELVKANFINITKDNGDIAIYGDYFITFQDRIDDSSQVVYDIANDEEFRGYEKWALRSYVKFSEKENRIEEFEELALESCGGDKIGVKALMALKGDVDNMGTFLKDKKINSFAHYNFMSRLIDYFFSVNVSQMMKDKNIYTIFAGGDDLFVIGAWDEVLELSKTIRKSFMQFTEGSSLSISMGIEMFKPSKPINYIAYESEKALEKAKEVAGKDALTLFGETVKWDDYLDDLGLYDELEKTDPNTAFAYRLLELIDMSKKVKYDNDIVSTIWKSKLAYSFGRNMTQTDQPLLNTLNEMIENYPKEAKMKVSEFIYKRRD